MKRVLAERRRDVRALDLDELDRQRAGLEDECKVLRFLDRLQPGDFGPSARDSVGQRVEIDRRIGANLAVEDDGEALLVVVPGRPLRVVQVCLLEPALG